MKGFRVSAVLVLFWALFSPMITFAGDYVTDTLEALKSSNVYVAPGTEGTDNDTVVQLNNMLNENDNIVLIMLPKDAANEGDLLSVVMLISQGLNDEKIIGLAIGKDVIGYAPRLPSGVASDQMRRADNVSNSPVTALTTFAQNIHLWQMNNPQPTNSPTPRPTTTPVPTATPRPTPVPLTAEQKKTRDTIVLTVAAVGFIIGVLFMVVLINNTAKEYKRQEAIRRRQEEKRLRIASMKPTEDTLHRIERNVRDLSKARLRNEILKACKMGFGLLEIIYSSPTALGYNIEERFPVLVNNMEVQIKAVLQHESGRRPLTDDNLSTLFQILASYDDIFLNFQSGTPEAEELVQSIIATNNAMISTLGRLPGVNE